MLGRGRETLCLARCLSGTIIIEEGSGISSDRHAANPESPCLAKGEKKGGLIFFFFSSSGGGVFSAARVHARQKELLPGLKVKTTVKKSRRFIEAKRADGDAIERTMVRSRSCRKSANSDIEGKSVRTFRGQQARRALN